MRKRSVEHSESEARSYLLLGWVSPHSLLATPSRFSGVARTETRSTSHHTRPTQNTACAAVYGCVHEGDINRTLRSWPPLQPTRRSPVGCQQSDTGRTRSPSSLYSSNRSKSSPCQHTQSCLSNSSVNINGIARTCTPATEGRGRSPLAALTMNVFTRPSSRVCSAVSDSKSRSPSLAFGSFSFLQKRNKVRPFFAP